MCMEEELAHGISHMCMEELTHGIPHVHGFHIFMCMEELTHGVHGRSLTHGSLVWHSRPFTFLYLGEGEGKGLGILASTTCVTPKELHTNQIAVLITFHRGYKTCVAVMIAPHTGSHAWTK